MGVDVGYNICLPPEYGRTNVTMRFPVIYYLHGYKGDESSFLEYVDYWRQSLPTTGPAILVLANGGRTTFFSDAPDESLMGETVILELIDHIDRTFRTVATREGRSLHGYSMGGFGALKLAFKHPQRFHSVVAYGATLSSAADAKKHLGKIYSRMFGGDEAKFQANNPMHLAERRASALKDLRVRLVVGTRDEFLEENQRLFKRLVALGVEATLKEVPGTPHKKQPLYEEEAVESFLFSASDPRRADGGS